MSDHPMTSTPSPPLLSPPDSQHHNPTMPTAPSGTALANSNGKRPHGTISNGDDPSLNASTSGLTVSGGNASNGASTVAGTGSVNGAGASATGRGEFAPKLHAASGYTWERAEDEPGWAWMNKKAQDEYGRAAEGLVHAGGMIGGMYGDPIEVAERERAGLAGGAK